jgi:hypothetical protein
MVAGDGDHTADADRLHAHALGADTDVGDDPQPPPDAPDAVGRGADSEVAEERRGSPALRAPAPARCRCGAGARRERGPE